MLRTSIIAAVAATAVAGPVFAGSYEPAPVEPVIATPAPAPVYTGSDWTGGYVGGSLGYGDLKADGDSGDGTVYGLQGGYDYDFGSFVLGGELDYQASDVSISGVDVDSMTRLKLKAGYDAGPALIYGVVGAARADTDLGDDTGWVYGAGVDYKVSEKVSVGGEYLYHQIDDFNGTGTDLEGGTLSARVNYRF